MSFTDIKNFFKNCCMGIKMCTKGIKNSILCCCCMRQKLYDFNTYVKKL